MELIKQRLKDCLELLVILKVGTKETNESSPKFAFLDDKL